MDERISIDGERIILKEMTADDVGENYVQWMNDEETTQYMESRFQDNTLESIREYVKKISERPNDFIFMIIEKESDRHIGNIRLGPINMRHGFSEVGVMIGDKASWGKGYATEAIRLLAKYAFEALKLHKLNASCYSNNLGSRKAFEKAGFKSEGTRKSQYKFGNEYVDVFMMGLVNE